MIRSRCLLLMAFVALAIGCNDTPDSNSNQNSNQATNQTISKIEDAGKVNDDLDILEMMIKLPFHPIDGRWREDDFKKTNGTVRKLTAVIKFTKEDAAKFPALATPHRQPVVEMITPDDWYPEELIAQSQMSGDETLKGTTYGANDFFYEPFVEGKVTRIDDTDYFVLELYTK